MKSFKDFLDEAKKESIAYEVIKDLSDSMIKETGNRRAWGWDPYHSINAEGEDVKGIRIGFNDNRKKYILTFMEVLNGVIQEYGGNPDFVRSPLNDEFIKFPDSSQIKVMVSSSGTIAAESRS